LNRVPSPAHDVRPPWRVAALGILTAAICIILAFHHLGANSIFADESITADVARRAAVDGHWYPLENNEGTYVAKPPLSVWPIALWFEIGGPSELNARIGSAAGGVLASMLLFALGTWLVDAFAGTIAALLLITAPPWLLEHGVREGVGDVWTTLFTGVALVLYVRARVTESRRMLLAAIVAAATASLIKGPVVFLVLAGVGLLWELAARSLLPRPRRWGVLCGFVLASAIPFTIWIADSTARGGVVRAKLWKQFFGRHLQAIDPTHVQGATFYPGVLAQAFGLSLLCLLLPSMWNWLRSSELGLLLPLWAAFPIVAFSLSVSKLPWYLDPSLPPLALLIAIAIVLSFGGLRMPMARYAAGAIVAAFLAVRVLGAWNAIQVTRRTDMNRLLLAYRSAERPILYVDDPGPGSFQYREWNAYYLNLARSEWRTIPRAIDRSRCSVVITTHPDRLTRRADFAGAELRQLWKYDPREANLYVIDLCGGRFANALGTGGV